MATLDVQPKKKAPVWPWILAVLAVILILYFLLRGRDNSATDPTRSAAPTDTVSANSNLISPDDNSAWGDIDFNTPAVTYEEINDKDISVRGNDSYTIYSVDEPILFDKDKSTLSNKAAQDLKQVAASIGKRYEEGEVRIYGYTDAQGRADYNKDLAQQRAEAVRDWLVKNGNIAQDRISLHPVGESQPVASNDSEQGRQQNRRVEIVARKS